VWSWDGGVHSQAGTAQRRNVLSECFTIDHSRIRSIHAVMFYPPAEVPVPNWPPYNGNWPVPRSHSEANSCVAFEPSLPSRSLRRTSMKSLQTPDTGALTTAAHSRRRLSPGQREHDAGFRPCLAIMGFPTSLSWLVAAQRWSSIRVGPEKRSHGRARGRQTRAQ